MVKQGLFVGLITGDLLYLADHAPQGNEKIAALDYCFTAGGPATNAAIAFQYCGSSAKLIGVLGQQALGNLLRDEIKKYGVEVINIQTNGEINPPMSSIIVTQSTGERAVISLNAKGLAAKNIADQLHFCREMNVILIDGHQMELSAAIATEANHLNIPIVVDAGSWKPNFETVLSLANYVICSANFYPPQCQTTAEIVNYLKNLGIEAIAITQGEKPILWWQDNHQGEIPVPPTKVVDTLGAGDIFHGAFCHYILQQDFATALKSAAKIASYACQFFGTRAWLNSDFRHQISDIS